MWVWDDTVRSLHFLNDPIYNNGSNNNSLRKKTLRKNIVEET